ncbi:MAG: DbpA RNA binding domain-containing protein, partial [Fibrobacterota bacterium]
DVRGVVGHAVMAFGEDVDPDYFSWAKDLLEQNKPAEVLASILSYCFKETLNADAYKPVKEGGLKERQLDSQGKARLFMAMGKKDGVTPKRLADLVMEQIKIKNRMIDDIQVMDSFSFITVPFEKAEEIIGAFKEKGRQPLFTHAKGKSGTDKKSGKRPPRSAEPGRKTFYKGKKTRRS